MLGQCMMLSLPEPSGWRPYLVVELGRRWARVINLEDADSYRIPVTMLEKRRPWPIKFSRMAKRLRDVAACYDRAALARITDQEAAKKFTWPRTRLAKKAIRLARQFA